MILLSAGSNAKGQLGIGSDDDAHIFTPCRFASKSSAAELDNNSESNRPRPGLPEYTARVVQIACGANHTVLLLEHCDGSTALWGAGDGRKGQLGLGYSRRDGPDNHDDESSRRSDDGIPTSPTVFRQLELGPEQAALPECYSAYGVRMVAAAWESTYVVLSSFHSAASTSTSTSGSTTAATTPTLSLSHSRGDSVHSDHDANSDSDVLLSMGSNDFGALGVGERLESHGSDLPAMTPTGSPKFVALGRVLSDSSEPLQASSGRRSRSSIRVRSLHAGPRHVVAELVVTRTHLNPRTVAANESFSQMTTTKTVLVGWGACRHGQLGPDLNESRFVSRPTLLPIDVHEDPMVSCALGNQHTVVLHASGRISALGSNKQGQVPPSSLVLGDAQPRICKLGCTWNGTYVHAIGENDEHVLLSMGNNAQGQLGRDRTVDTVSAVSLPAGRAILTFVCGSEHALAVVSSASLEGHSVLGWGWNEHGNMGLGFRGNVTIPTQLWPSDSVETYERYPQKVVAIWAGCATSWLLVE